MRYGIIGTGYSFRAHAATLALIDGARIVAVCGRNAERLERARETVGGSCKAYNDYRQLVEDDDVEVVIVSTPNATHAEIAGAALAAGKHVLCEKPMGVTPDEASALAAQAGRAPGRLFVGLELRCTDLFNKVGDVIASGAIGKPSFFWLREIRGYFQSGSDGWRFSDATGGMLVEKSVHHFDIFNWLTGGRAARVAGMGGNVCNTDKAGDDEAMVVVEYDNGARAGLNVCLHGPWMSYLGSHQVFGVVGEEAMLEAFLDARRLCVTRGLDDQEMIDLGSAPFQEKYEALPGYRRDYDNWFCLLYPEHLEIAKAIAGEQSRAPGPEIGYESVLVTCAAQEAVRRREVVDIEAMRRKR